MSEPVNADGEYAWVGENHLIKIQRSRITVIRSLYISREHLADIGDALQK